MPKSFTIIVPDTPDMTEIGNAVSTQLTTYLRTETRLALVKHQSDALANEVGPEIVLHTLGLLEPGGEESPLPSEMDEF